MRLLIRFLIGVFFLISGSTVYGWYDAGHMSSSWITWQLLTPDARKESQRLINILSEAEPATSDFIVASAWMDSIKQNGFDATMFWHTVSAKQVDDGLPAGPSAQNGVWVVEKAIKALSNPYSSDFSKAFMLRVLLHAGQDLHSPMHVCNDEPDRPPEHDKCYKSFRIETVPFKGEFITNIASLWDSGVTAFPPTRSYDENAKKDISIYSQPLFQRVKVDRDLVSELEPMVWAKESLALQRNFALKGVKNRQALSPDYLQQGRLLSEQRIVLAGYRLAGVLNNAFKSK